MPNHLTPAQLAAKLAGHLSPEERAVVEAAGYGRRIGFGQRPALLVVDVTYGFCGNTPRPILESIAEQRRSCGAPAWQAVEQIAALIEQARRSKIPVVFSAMEDPSSPEYEPGLWGAKNKRGVEDRRGRSSTNNRDNQVVAEIAPRPGEMVFAKNKPSMFQGTGLLPYLIGHQVDSLIICGGVTSGCVYATAVDGFSNNYTVSVVADAIFDRVQIPHWVFLLDIDLKYGDAVTTGMVLDHVKSLGR